MFMAMIISMVYSTINAKRLKNIWIQSSYLWMNCMTKSSRCILHINRQMKCKKSIHFRKTYKFRILVNSIFSCICTMISQKKMMERSNISNYNILTFDSFHLVSRMNSCPSIRSYCFIFHFISKIHKKVFCPTNNSRNNMTLMTSIFRKMNHGKRTFKHVTSRTYESLTRYRKTKSTILTVSMIFWTRISSIMLYRRTNQHLRWYRFHSSR